MREAVEAAGFEIESAELTMLPKTTVAVEDESEAKKILRLMDQLEDNDDVQEVYANFDIPETGARERRRLAAVRASDAGVESPDGARADVAAASTSLSSCLT